MTDEKFEDHHFYSAMKLRKRRTYVVKILAKPQHIPPPQKPATANLGVPEKYSYTTTK